MEYEPLPTETTHDYSSDDLRQQTQNLFDREYWPYHDDIASSMQRKLEHNAKVVRELIDLYGTLPDQVYILKQLKSIHL